MILKSKMRKLNVPLDYAIKTTKIIWSHYSNSKPIKYLIPKLNEEKFGTFFLNREWTFDNIYSMIKTIKKEGLNSYLNYLDETNNISNVILEDEEIQDEQEGSSLGLFAPIVYDDDMELEKIIVTEKEIEKEEPEESLNDIIQNMLNKGISPEDLLNKYVYPSITKGNTDSSMNDFLFDNVVKYINRKAIITLSVNNQGNKVRIDLELEDK